jgi:hypothetical protein
MWYAIFFLQLAGDKSGAGSAGTANFSRRCFFFSLHRPFKKVWYAIFFLQLAGDKSGAGSAGTTNFSRRCFFYQYTVHLENVVCYLPLATCR